MGFYSQHFIVEIFIQRSWKNCTIDTRIPITWILYLAFEHMCFIKYLFIYQSSLVYLLLFIYFREGSGISILTPKTSEFIYNVYKWNAFGVRLFEIICNHLEQIIVEKLNSNILFYFQYLDWKVRWEKDKPA